MPHTFPELSAASLRRGRFVFALLAAGSVASASPDSRAVAANFRQHVEPLLEKYCYDCHGFGVGKGNVTFDEFETDADILKPRDTWLAALRNVRAGVMPPFEEGAPRPQPEEIERIAHWIKYQAFGLDPANPDPGRVTLRRLNRVEYRNTIRDLMGIDYNAETEFPPDDSGHGFDNNGDVLTLSPLLLEKYLSAAEAIVDRAVPKVPQVMRERVLSGREFKTAEGGGGADTMRATRAVTVSRTFTTQVADDYQIRFDLEVRGSFDFDPARCEVVGRLGDTELFRETVVWRNLLPIPQEVVRRLEPGEHRVSVEIIPLEPAVPPETVVRSPNQPATHVTVRLNAVTIAGPTSPENWVVPENHARFFPDGAAPAEAKARDAYAEKVLRRFATAAFRRPVEEGKLANLVALARQTYTTPGTTFERGIARAMMAVLASPRFLFRVEGTTPHAPEARVADVDEWALASRLSYFLWSTMPDQTLFDLAARGELRSQLRAQVARMLRDEKAQAFVRNFTGQWLQARDVESVPLNARVVMGTSGPRNREGRVDFDSDWRKLMRSETERYFDYVLQQDRSIVDLIDSDYTFLNEKLAAFYGVEGVAGDELRRVQLPAGSPRGGVLTQGTVLAVTSNPTRTSPVKRGMFILENILGTPPPPAPPDVPDLEEAREAFKGREPKLSEMLAVHRANTLCNSCHSRMDPLGLAMENFNALGAWRDTEAEQPIEPAGRLITGETFADVRELKRILANERKVDVFRCLTEKLLMYALGRGLEYHDTEAVDGIVDRLIAENGRMSALVLGVIESVPFQKTRLTSESTPDARHSQ